MWRNVIEVIAIDVLANPFAAGIRIGKGAISRIYDYVLQLFFRQGIFTPTRAFMIALLFPFVKYFYHPVIERKRTFYHPLSIVEFLTADYLNKGRLCLHKGKNNPTQLQNEDIFFGRIGAYALALSGKKSDSADVNAFKKIIGTERRVLEDFVTRTDIVHGKASSIRMTKVDVSNLRNENLRILTGYFDGSREVAESYMDFVTRLYIHVFLKMYKSEWEKIEKLNLVRVEPSPLASELAKEEAEERPTG